MSLSKMLDYPDTQMVVVQSRYGFGWIAGVEVEEFPVITTANDNNGEHGVDYYGLMSADDSWFPYATGSTPLEAAAALNEKLKGWTKYDFANVRLGLGILRKLEKFPTVGLQVRPITLKDLAAWQHGWNHGDVRDEDMFV